MNKCRCGSSNHLFYIRDPLTGACGWMCYSCNRNRFPKGSTVFMFMDTSHRLQARYYVSADSEKGCDEIISLGEWGQMQGENVVEISIYQRWLMGTGGASGFNMGHPDSLKNLSSNVDRIRLLIPMKEVILQRGAIQTTLE